MKKNIIAALVLTAALAATGCTQNNTSSASDNKSTSAATSSTTGSASSSSSSDTSSESSAPDTEQDGAFSGLAGYDGTAKNTNVVSGGSFCETENGFYYADNDGVYAVESDKTTQIYKGKSGYLNNMNGRIMFLQEKGNICMVLDGKAYNSAAVSAAELACTPSANYYIDTDGKLHKIRGGDTVINDAKCSGLNIAGDYVIFSETDTGRIAAYNSADNSIFTVVEKGTKPVVFGDKLYYVNADSNIGCVSLKDGTVTEIKAACDSVAPADDVIYITNGTKLLSVSDGAEPAEVYSCENAESVIADVSVCGGKLYFSVDGVDMVLTDGTASAFTVKAD